MQPTKIKKFIFIVLTILQTLGTPFSEAKTPKVKTQSFTPEALSTHCHLKLGWGEWPPYQYLPSKANQIPPSPNEIARTQPQGIQIDLIREIATEAGCELSYVLQSFTENMASIKDGTIDLTLDSTITEQRKLFAYFSEPYRNEVLVLYVRPKFLQQCQSQSLKSLVAKGLRLGLTSGNLYGKVITDLQEDAQLNTKLIYQEKNSQNLEKLKTDELDAVLEDPAVMAYQLRRQKLIGSMKSCKVTVQSEPVSIMFSKKTVPIEVLKRFNAALIKIKQTEHYLANWSW